MNYKNFVELVCKMRTAQKSYFRTRSYAVLDNSKILERQVDNALREISDPKNQLSLFPGSVSPCPSLLPLYMVAISKTPPAMYIINVF